MGELIAFPDRPRLSEHMQFDHMDKELHQAITAGNYQGVMGMLTENPNMVRKVTFCDKNNALHLAALHKRKRIVELIVRLDPSLIYRTNEKNEETPLHIAAREGDPDLTETLLKAVSENREAEEGQRLLKMVNLRGDSALHEAARHGRLEVAKLLLKMDPSQASLKNEAGESPLSISLDGGFEEIACCIIDNAPACSYEGRGGMNAVHLTASQVRLNGFLKELLKRIQDESLLKERDSSGSTPIHCAAYENNCEAIGILIGRNGNLVYLTDNEGMTPLLIGAREGYVGVIKKVVEACPDVVEQTDSKGRTALHIAILNDRERVVQYILKTQAFRGLTTVRDEDDNTPSDYAAMLRRRTIFSMLRKYDGITNYVNKNGLNPYDIYDDKPLFHEGQKGRKSKRSRLFESVTSNKKDKGKSCSADGGENKSTEGSKIKSEDSEDSPHAGAREKSPSRNKKLIKKRLEKIDKWNMVAGAFVATITYTAAVQVPGGYDDKGQPWLKDTIGFQVFFWADEVAFVFSLMSIVHSFCATFMKLSPTVAEGLLFSAGLLINLALASMTLTFFSGMTITMVSPGMLYSQSRV